MQEVPTKLHLSTIVVVAFEIVQPFRQLDKDEYPTIGFPKRNHVLIEEFGSEVILLPKPFAIDRQIPVDCFFVLQKVHEKGG